MKDLQQPGGRLALEFRLKLTGAAEAALLTVSVSQCSEGLFMFCECTMKRKNVSLCINQKIFQGVKTCDNNMEIFLSMSKNLMEIQVLISSATILGFL